jgi:hypothetical protein
MELTKRLLHIDFFIANSELRIGIITDCTFLNNKYSDIYMYHDINMQWYKPKSIFCFDTTQISRDSCLFFC